ncbi:hypothetical protein DPMN_093211 [Dreissena polymorpha]|uniref:Secreted protein n=1 Tax=Dreissena polymorpha TaxID=45954 RepID=A0A9D4R1J0_DREPO|nr:hypothetical protein DPMN_093211 [Dreissena polymorpha]
MVMHSLWYVIVVHLFGAEEEEFVCCLRLSVGRRRLYFISVPREQSTPPTYKRNHNERARASPPRTPAYGPAPRPPSRPHTAPPRAPNRWSLPRQAPSFTLLLRATTDQPRTDQGVSQSHTRNHHRSFPPPPNIQSLYHAGLY